MASFFEKNKRKSALALLLLFLKWRKGLAPLLLIVALLMAMSFAPGNLIGICLSGLARLPGGAPFAAAVTWSASKAGLEIGGVPRQNSYRDYLAAFRLAGDQGFSGLLQKRSFKDLIDAFHTARYDRNAAMNLLFHNAAGAAGPGSGLDMVKKGGDSAAVANIGGGKSISGVMTAEEAKDVEKGVALDEADLEGERAGMVDSALASMGGDSGPYASKAFFDGPAAQGAPGGSRVGQFGQGMSSKGGGARMTQTSRRGGRSLYLGRRGTTSSKAVGTLRGMVTVNQRMRTGTTTEDASSSATEQWEGSPLTGSQATLPSTPPSLQGGAGSFGGIPGGGAGSGGGAASYAPGDPGIVCTSYQLAQGMVSNGRDCVVSTNGVHDNATPWQNDAQDATDDILAGMGLAILASGLDDIGAILRNIGQNAGGWWGAIIQAIGVIFEVFALVGYLASAVKLAMGMALGIKMLGQGGDEVFQGLLDITAAGAGLVRLFQLLKNVFATSYQGQTVNALLNNNFVTNFIFILFLAGALFSQFGGAPQVPQTDAPTNGASAAALKANADDGSADGLPPPPPNMHYEMGPDGKLHLEYNYNTFVFLGQTPPNVEYELNTQKGGGDSGFPPAPAGEHYEGVDKNGQPKLVPDYAVGVAQREDADSFKGGPPTQLPPAPSGQHYELTNQGGDPTDPKSWKLVNDYSISSADLKAANAQKGQPGTQCAASGQAPAGKHYEGVDCHLVKDYPVH